MNPELFITKAVEFDIEDFTNIKAKAYADDRKKSVPVPEETPKWYYGDWYVGLGIPNKAENERLMKEFECYMISLNGISIGIFWIECEEADSLTIEDFCILPEYQGKGYGKQVLKLIEKLYPKNKRWLLTTPTFCKKNCHLYEKSGFHNIGLVSDDSVVLYEKIL